MRRRTFVSSVAAFVCLPFPVLRRKCPYRIETVDTFFPCYRLLDGNETVGWYNCSNRKFITGFDKSAIDFDEKLKQIIPGDYHVECYHSIVLTRYDWFDRNNIVATLYSNHGGFVLESPSAVYIKIPQDFSPEQAAWKMYEIRKILDA